MKRALMTVAAATVLLGLPTRPVEPQVGDYLDVHGELGVDSDGYVTPPAFEVEEPLEPAPRASAYVDLHRRPLPRIRRKF